MAARLDDVHLKQPHRPFYEASKSATNGKKEEAGGVSKDRPLDDSHTLQQMWGFRFYEALPRIEKAGAPERTPALFRLLFLGSSLSTPLGLLSATLGEGEHRVYELHIRLYRLLRELPRSLLTSLGLLG